MEFRCFTDWNQLPESSNRLFACAEKDSLFFSRCWFESLAATSLRSDQDLLLACVVAKNHRAGEGDVLAVLPLVRNGDEELTSLHHMMHTSLYTLLLEENCHQQEVIDCLARGLAQLPFASLTLEPVAEDDDNINRLRNAMEVLGFSSNRYLRFVNWFYPLQGEGFSGYMAARPSRLRNTITRKQRKLEREHGYDIRLYRGRDVQQAMQEYHAVYAASWKPEETRKDVVEGLADSLARREWTRLAILHVQGEPVAAQLWFVVHGKASIFKLAYDEAWKKYSPGSILTRYLMEYVIDTDKVQEIDFLTGNDRYKQEWMTEHRRRWKVVISGPPGQGGGRTAWAVLKNWLTGKR